MPITDQSAKDVMNASQRIDQVIKTFEKIVGKILCFYGITGNTIMSPSGEAANEEVGVAFVIGLSHQMKRKNYDSNAFTGKEFDVMVNKLPSRL